MPNVVYWCRNCDTPKELVVDKRNYPVLQLPLWKGLSMISINGYQLPEHISYSSMTTFLDCGHLYFLTRVVGLEEAPAWWFAGGSAVHEASEEYDKGSI